MWQRQDRTGNNENIFSSQATEEERTKTKLDWIHESTGAIKSLDVANNAPHVGPAAVMRPAKVGLLLRPLAHLKKFQIKLQCS